MVTFLNAVHRLPSGRLARSVTGSYCKAQSLWGTLVDQIQRSSVHSCTMQHDLLIHRDVGEGRLAHKKKVRGKLHSRETSFAGLRVELRDNHLLLQFGGVCRPAGTLTCLSCDNNDVKPPSLTTLFGLICPACGRLAFHLPMWGNRHG